MAQPTATPLLRTHPLTGKPIRPIGTRPNGDPLWPIMGGSETPPEGGQQPPAGGQPTPPAGGQPPATPPADQAVDLTKLSADDLKAHPAFQTEINRVVGERLTKEQEKWQAKLEQERQRANLDEAGKLQADLDAARQEAQQASEAQRRAFELVARTKAEVLAIAEGGRADRASAIVGQADLTGATNEDGSVNEAVVKAAIVKVLGSYPEWKTEGGQLPPGQPPRSGGDLSTPPAGGRTFTESQIKAMTQEQVAELMPEIEKAMAEGRFIYGQ